MEISDDDNRFSNFNHVWLLAEDSDGVFKELYNLIFFNRAFFEHEFLQALPVWLVLVFTFVRVEKRVREGLVGWARQGWYKAISEWVW